MKRVDAGNLLMVSAGVIVALHTGLFSVWVSALSGGLLDVAKGISVFGAIFITLNIIFWVLARVHFQKEILETKTEKPLNIWLSTGLVMPFILVLIGWSLTAVKAQDLCGSKCNVHIEKTSKVSFNKKVKHITKCSKPPSKAWLGLGHQVFSSIKES